ncbi:MAG: hypothetical protein E7H60_23180 [Pseudomonas oryzihabitans]|uniref:hypothetical protein n=1 Tax=Pseudomonas oryzihabitans TaxID=47885 RepID=UPI0029117064|nr:hypothetical protein [Pseudomonas oryzihabitans]MDU4059452.1 hypothetical protein [Pseudomonas oryzihabitans]
MKVREMPQMAIRLKPELKVWLEERAAKEERSQNWLIGKILEEERQREQKLSGS